MTSSSVIPAATAVGGAQGDVKREEAAGKGEDGEIPEVGIVGPEGVGLNGVVKAEEAEPIPTLPAHVSVGIITPYIAQRTLLRSLFTQV